MSVIAKPASFKAASMVLKQLRDWLVTSGGVISVAKSKPWVPARKQKSPSATARLKPAAFSNGEPVEIRRRDIGYLRFCCGSLVVAGPQPDSENLGYLSASAVSRRRRRAAFRRSSDGPGCP